MSELKYYRPRILDRISLDRHSLIEASAGTGKTFTIENLVVELLLTAAATIEQILVVTFTEKATSELRARIRSTLELTISGRPPEHTPEEELRTLDHDARRKLEDALFAFDRAPIYTIHGFCHRTLSELAFPSGMRFGIEITDKEIAFHEAFRAELRDYPGSDRNAGQLMREWLAEANIEKLEQLLYQADRVRYLSTDDYRRNRLLSAQGRATLALEVRVTDALLPRIAERMNRLKRERGVLDYDDMLEWLARALDGPQGDELGALMRKRYRHALIDEFQDTDDSQWEIFRRVFVEAGGGQNCLHIIGDPKQAIYSFRGADVHTYLAAKRDLHERGVEPLPLVRNFRSTGKLIAAINAILKQDEPSPFFDGEIRYDFPVTCGREDLRARSADDSELTPVTLMRLDARGKLSAEATRNAIASHIANAIRTMLNTAGGKVRISSADGSFEPVCARDIFVLTRTNKESRTVGAFLREANVPFAFYKQEGLFQTREAGDIVDALKGVLEPGVQSRRLAAWATPFFAVPYAELPKTIDLPPSHRLLERLYEWKTLADEKRFAELFDAMLHRSGLVDRELYLSNSERELTNYLHIFEILLHKAATQKLVLAELIELLEEYIVGRALPDGEDSDVQRLESERDAVQIMTVHKSKGLEADVVFLFGGTHRSGQRDQAVVFHENGQRRIAIGTAAKRAANSELNREDSEESQRLMYVAITRARVKLYLPYFPDGSTQKKLNGPYLHINRQLQRIVAQSERARAAMDLFEIQDIQEARQDAPTTTTDLTKALASWDPPAQLLDDSHDRDASRTFTAFSTRHAALTISSYTMLQAARDSAAGNDFIPEDFKTGVNAIDASTGIADLPGGRNVGIFLHEVIEQLDFRSFDEAPDFRSWSARSEVRELFVTSMRRHGVRDQRWLDRGRQIVFNVMTSRLLLGDTDLTQGLHRLRSVREMEFDYPTPEPSHPLLNRSPAGSAWPAERGYVKGFIDFVFTHQGKTYFADWKSDLLPSYRPDALKQHVNLHYELQAQIYSIGIIRLLGIRSEPEYRDKFGGLVYLFMRGVSPTDGTAGVHFIRPAWTDILDYEASLIDPNTDARIDSQSNQ